MTQAKTEKFAKALHHLGALRPDAPLGVLDIGSNSVRLVGYSGSARTPLPIYNERAFCRLGESVSATGRIEGEPYKLALMTLRRFRAIAERLGIGDLAAFATAAVRDAKNSTAFVAEAEAVLGHKIRVLSGREEAVFSADGVMLAMPGSDGVVADLGGGSLELAHAHSNKTHHWASLPLGVLALRELGGRELPLHKLGAQKNSQNPQAAHQEMENFIQQQLAQVDWLPKTHGKPLYIVGGNWRNLAKLHMERTHYGLDVLHHYQVKPDAMLHFARDIVAMRARDANLIATVSNNRRANMPIAALVLQHLLQAIEPKQVIVSAHAVREGVLYSILQKEFRRLDPLLLACEEMAALLCKSAAYGYELADWTRKLFTHAKPKWASRKQLERLRQAGCLIADLAWAAHPNFRAFMVSNTVLTAPFVGIDHLGRVFLANALAFRHEMNEVNVMNGDRPINTSGLHLPPRDQKLACALGLSFRLAHSLSASLPHLLPHTRLRAGRKKLRLRIDPKYANLISPIIEKRLALVASALDLQPIITVKKVKSPPM